MPTALPITVVTVLTLATLLPAPAVASPAAAVGAEVARARRHVPNLGVHVAEVAGGRSVYGHRADELLILASNTKILTTAAALDGLGPGYFFETRLLARGRLEDGVLLGDLGVVGGGDPSLSGRFHMGDDLGPFRRWAESLTQRGIRRVSGKLYLDHGFFAPPQLHPDWDPGNNMKWYQVPVAGLGFKENALVLRASPGARAGAPAQVKMIPPLPFFDIDNRLRTLASRRGHRLGVRRAGGPGELEVWGGIYRGSGSQEIYAAVADPVIYFGAALRQALAQEGIEIDGEIEPVVKLPGLIWQEVAVHRSSLLDAIEITNRESQNFYAESLLKTLGAQLCGRGTWENGLRAARELLGDAGIEAGSYHLADGSGLSRNNRMTPRQMTGFLSFMAGHPWGHELMASLPRGGQDGSSLKKRLREPRYAPHVFAKTGTLIGVSTLSGYARGRSGRLYAFSVLANDTAAWRARQAQDAIVRAIIDHG